MGALHQVTGSHSRWYNLTRPERRAADERGDQYWAFLKNPPALKALGWGNGPSRLMVQGNISKLVGDDPHDYKFGLMTGSQGERVLLRPLSVVAVTQPICLTAVNIAAYTNLSDYCLQLLPYNIIPHPHHTKDLGGHTTQVNVTILAIPHDMTLEHLSTSANAQAPPLCRQGDARMWAPFRACSTGVLRKGPRLTGNLTIQFWDAMQKYVDYAYIPAPAPIALPLSLIHI